jgi:Zn-finger nucleic acid-binding protein
MKKSQSETRICPVCSVELEFTDRQGVRLDQCPNCRGVWLDRTELDKVIERSCAEATKPEPSGAIHMGATEEWSHLHSGHAVKQRGFLSDLFG